VRATRDWFGDALLDAGRRHDVVVVDCDLGSATCTQAFRDAYPDRFFACGIAEANAIGIAAGLAQEGFRPFLTSFGHFLTGKFLEIFQSVGFNAAGVVLVGSHAGLAIGRDGPTQMGLRDVALMRTLPNVEIIHPADGPETRAALTYMTSSRRPTYLRVCRQPQRDVHRAEPAFQFGQPDVLVSGQELVVFAMGAMVAVVLDAVPALAEHGLRPTVVNVSSLPVRPAALSTLAAGHTAAYVVEDHSMTGGLADEIGRILLDQQARLRFGSAGVPDYGQAAAPEDLYRWYQLDAEGVTARLRAFMDGGTHALSRPRR
jgi:transketolase